MKEPIKKLTQKYEWNWFASSWSSLSNVINTVNEIIDYIQPVPPTDTKEGEEKQWDWIDYLWDRHFKDDSRREKQGLRNQIESAIDICKPTQSTLDEVVEKIVKKLYNTGLKLDNTRQVFIKEILSPYIQDKQEQLIPLPNLHELAKEIEANLTLNNNPYWTSVIYLVLKTVLSKYWQYPKQEEDEWITLEEAEEQIKQCTGIDKQYAINDCKTATEAQVIQREREHELIQAYEKWKKDTTPTPQATSVDVENIINNIECTVHWDCYTIDYKSLKEYLSSLPIVQKKRTEDKNYTDTPWHEWAKC